MEVARRLSTSTLLMPFSQKIITPGVAMIGVDLAVWFETVNIHTHGMESHSFRLQWVCLAEDAGSPGTGIRPSPPLQIDARLTWEGRHSTQ